MKYLIRIVSIIGLFSMAQLACAVDLFQTGETLTADKLNDIDQRIMTLEKIYAIGDVGPAGGWVFYVTVDGLHGLEAAPAYVPGAPLWGCPGFNNTGALGSSLGTGERNTIEIVIECQEADIAARLADDFVSPSGYYDWFLPSQDEMVRMGALYPLIPPVGIDSMISGFHWSSTETEEDPPPADPFDDFAVVVNIGGAGSEGIGVPCLDCSPKQIERMARAVRTF